VDLVGLRGKRRERGSKGLYSVARDNKVRETRNPSGKEKFSSFRVGGGGGGGGLLGVAEKGGDVGKRKDN